MDLACKITRIKKGHYESLFAIKLKSVRVLSADARSNYNEFVINQLGRQMDVVHSLHEEPTEHTIELRYLYHPDKPNIIDVYFLVKIMESRKSNAIPTSKSFCRYLINQLMVNNSQHDFERVQDPGILEYLIEPFEFRHISEVIRREDMIPLDTAKSQKRRHMGFQIKDGTSAECKNKDDGTYVYYVFPYAINLDNMARLCHTLYLQEAPTLISICLKPYKLTEKDESILLKRLNTCEKYSQLQLSRVDDRNIDNVVPYLKKQANLLYQECSSELSKLLDAAYLMKVQIVSSSEVPHEVTSISGSTLTEHTGHPRLTFSGQHQNDFIGGYDYYYPHDASQQKTAMDNFKNMKFSNWIPTIADKKFIHWRYLFDTSQAISAFRLPIPVEASFPGIDTRQYHLKSAPSGLPEDGMLIGEHKLFEQKQNIYIESSGLRSHAYIVGQTGTGKSTLFKHMILQDINAGNGIGVIDPHGELIEELLHNIPKKRKKDVIFLNPSDYEFPIGINMLEAKTDIEKDFCVNYLMEVFDLLYDLRETGGPMFEMYMRNSIQLLLDQSDESNISVLEVPRLFQDHDFRSMLLRNCTNGFVKNFWEKEADKVGGDSRIQDLAPYITSKLSRFVYNNTLRGIVGQNTSTIDFKSVIDTKKILLIDLRKGLLGKTNSAFLGMIIVGKLFAAALSRALSKSKKTLPPFYLYVDEFQNLATPTFAAILSEARKYKLSLTLANQYAAQVSPNILQGIFGNVGTLISFRVGLTDAQLISDEFGGQISTNDLMGLSNWNAYVRLLIDGTRHSPFNVKMLLPHTKEDPKLFEEICQLSRKKYGRARKEVEGRISKGWQI